MCAAVFAALGDVDSARQRTADSKPLKGLLPSNTTTKMNRRRLDDISKRTKADLRLASPAAPAATAFIECLGGDLAPVPADDACAVGVTIGALPRLVMYVAGVNVA